MSNGLAPEQGDPRWDERQIAQLAAGHGFKWLLADARYTPNPAVLVDACHQQGLRCGVWETAVEYGSPARVSVGYDAYVGQVEGPGQLDRVLKSAPPDCPHAVVANDFTGAPQLVALGYTHCIAECWVKTDPNTTPERQVAEALAHGFLTAAPMAGLGENGAAMDDYPTITSFPGYSIFTAETLFR